MAVRLVAHPARSDDAAGPDHMEHALDNGHLWDIVSGLGMFCPWQVRIWPPQFAVFVHFPTIFPSFFQSFSGFLFCYVFAYFGYCLEALGNGFICF